MTISVQTTRQRAAEYLRSQRLQLERTVVRGPRDENVWLQRQQAFLDILTSVGDDLTVSRINCLIGHEAVEFCCDECHRPAEALVHLGDEADYGVQSVEVCAACLKKAVDALPW